MGVRTNSAKMVIGTVLFMMCLASVLSACGKTAQQNPSMSGIDEAKMLNMNGNRHEPGTPIALPTVTRNGVPFVSVNKLVATLGFSSAWNAAAQRISIGDSDVIYQITGGSREAMYNDQVHQLKFQPVFVGNQMYISVIDALGLFQDDMQAKAVHRKLILYPYGPNESDQQSGMSKSKEPFFQEDTVQNSSAFVHKHIRNINMKALLRKGHTYLGVPYLFGAGWYPKTHRFDCSSFTQYLFGRFGVHLYRNARKQSLEGIAVSRKHLRNGDLMFFSVPGEFKSNRRVGHVGIYAGHGKMLNTYGKGGVRYTNINLPYWKHHFIKARRVAY